MAELRILGIDPGTESSAWLHLEDGKPVERPGLKVRIRFTLES